MLCMSEILVHVTGKPTTIPRPDFSCRSAAIMGGTLQKYNISECRLLGAIVRDPIHPSPLGQMLWSDLIMQQLVEVRVEKHGGRLPASVLP